jgi:hypothetical protein
MKEKGFENLLKSMMRRRLFISLVILITFLGIIAGIGVAISMDANITEQWKEFLLLLLGAFIGSYGKIIDYWFRDTDKDKMLVQKMDEEDGVSLSDTAKMDLKNPEPTPIIPDEFNVSIQGVSNMEITEPVVEEINPKGTEIDEDGDGVMDGIDTDGDGDIDEYFEHRQCEHIWGDANHDGEEECLICGLIKENS